MSDNNSLGSLLYAHFSHTKFNADALAINMGDITARMTDRCEDDVYFVLSVPSDGFSYKNDSLQVDSATADFELHVANCRYDHDTHRYHWSDDRRFAIVADPDRVNITVYQDGCELIESKLDDRNPRNGVWELPPTISKGDDEDINQLLCRAVQANTSRTEIIKAIEALLASYS